MERGGEGLGRGGLGWGSGDGMGHLFWKGGLVSLDGDLSDTSVDGWDFASGEGRVGKGPLICVVGSRDGVLAPNFGAAACSPRYLATNHITRSSTESSPHSTRQTVVPPS